MKAAVTGQGLSFYITDLHTGIAERLLFPRGPFARGLPRKIQAVIRHPVLPFHQEVRLKILIFFCRVQVFHGSPSVREEIFCHVFVQRNAEPVKIAVLLPECKAAFAAGTVEILFSFIKR